MAAGSRRLQIMRAVETLFTSRQVHEITLDDVIRQAGVGKGTLYRYFKDKDDLFFQTATSGFDDLHKMLTREKAGISFPIAIIRGTEKVMLFIIPGEVKERSGS